MSNPNFDPTLFGEMPANPNLSRVATEEQDPLTEQRLDWLKQAAAELSGQQTRSTQPRTIFDNLVQTGAINELTRDMKSINARGYAVDDVVDAYESALGSTELSEETVSVVGDVVASVVDSSIGYYKELASATGTSVETNALPVLFEAKNKKLGMTNFGAEQVAEAVFRTMSTIVALDGSNAAKEMMNHLGSIDAALAALDKDMLVDEFGTAATGQVVNEALAKKQELHALLTNYRTMLISSYGQVANLDTQPVVLTNRNISSAPLPEVRLTKQKEGGLLSRMFGKDRVDSNTVDEINRTDLETGRNLLFRIIDNAKSAQAEGTRVEMAEVETTLLTGLERNYRQLQNTEIVVNEGDTTVLSLYRIFNDEHAPDEARGQARAQLLKIAAEDASLPRQERRVNVLSMNREISETTARYAQEIMMDMGLSSDNLTEEAQNQAYEQAFAKARSEYGEVTQTDLLINDFFNKVVTDRSLRVVDMVKMATTLVPLAINATHTEAPQPTIWQQLGIDTNSLSPEEAQQLEQMMHSMQQATSDAADTEDPALHHKALAQLGREADEHGRFDNLRHSTGTVMPADSDGVQPLVYRDFDTTDDLTDDDDAPHHKAPGAAFFLSPEEMAAQQGVDFNTKVGMEETSLDEIRTDLDSIGHDSANADATQLTDEFVTKYLHMALVEAAQQAQYEERLTGQPSGIIAELGGAANVQKLLDIVATDAGGNLIVVEDGIIRFEPDLITQLEGISTEEAVDERGFLLSFIDRELADTVHGQLPVDWENYNAPTVPGKDASMVDTAHVTVEDFQYAVAQGLANASDLSRQGLTNSEVEFLTDLATNPELARTFWEHQGLNGLSYVETRTILFNLFGDGEINETISQGMRMTFPYFREGTYSESLSFSQDSEGTIRLVDDGTLYHEVDLDPHDWTSGNLLERTTDVMDLLVLMSQASGDGLAELQNETESLFNIESRVLAITTMEWRILHNLHTELITAQNTNDDLGALDVNSTGELTDLLVERGFNADRAAHVAALYTQSTAEQVYDFLEAQNLLPDALVAQNNDTFDWENFEPDTKWTVKTADEAIQVLTTPADAQTPPDPQHQAEAIYVVVDAILDNSDSLSDESRQQLEANLNMNTITHLLDSDVYNALIAPSDTTTTLNDRLVNAGLATRNNETGAYTITDPQLVALLTPSVLENLEDIIAPAPVSQDDETPFVWSNYADAGTFPIDIDPEDEANVWHTADGATATPEELSARSTDVFQLLGRIGNASSEQREALRGLGLEAVLKLTELEIDQILEGHVTSDLIKQEGSLYNALISLGLEPDEARAVSVIYENPATAIEINNRIPTPESAPGVDAVQDWKQVTKIGSSNLTPVDMNADFWETSEVDDLAARAPQVASLIVLMNQLDDKSTLQFAARGFGDGSILSGLSMRDLTLIATLTADEINAANGDIAKALDVKGLHPAEASQIAILFENPATVSNLINDLGPSAIPGSTPEVAGVWSNIKQINGANPVPFTYDSDIWASDATPEEVAQRAPQVATMVLKLNQLDGGLKSQIDLGALGLTDGGVLMTLTEDELNAIATLTGDDIERGVEVALREKGLEQNEARQVAIMIENGATTNIIFERIEQLAGANLSFDWSGAATDPTVEGWRDETTRMANVLGIIQDIRHLNGDASIQITSTSAQSLIDSVELAKGAMSALTAGRNISVQTVLGLDGSDIQAIKGIDWTQVNMSDPASVTEALTDAGLTATEAQSVTPLFVYEATVTNVLTDLASAQPPLPESKVDYAGMAVDKSTMVTTDWEDHTLSDRAKYMKPLIAGLVQHGSSVAGLNVEELSKVSDPDLLRIIGVMSAPLVDADNNLLTGAALEAELTRLLGSEPWVNDVVAILLNQATVDMIMDVIPEAVGTPIDWTSDNYTSGGAAPVVDLSGDVWADNSAANVIARLEQGFSILDRVLSATSEQQAAWETAQLFNVGDLRGHFVSVESIQAIRDGLTVELIEEKGGLAEALESLGLGGAANDFAALLTAKETIENILADTNIATASPETPFDPATYQVSSGTIDYINENWADMSLSHKVSYLNDILKTMRVLGLDDVAGISLDSLRGITVEDYTEIAELDDDFDPQVNPEAAEYAVWAESDPEKLYTELSEKYKDEPWGQILAAIIAYPNTFALIQEQINNRMQERL